MKTNDTFRIWVGQAEVVPLEGNAVFTNPGVGGFMPVAAFGESISDFTRKVTARLEALGVQVKQIEGVRLLSEVLQEKAIEPRLADGVRGLDRDGVAFGTLFTFTVDDDSHQC